MELDKLVPACYIDVTKCFAIDFILDRQPVGLAVICTSSGQLLEFVDQEVSNTFDLNKEADEINVFTSYDPVQKFYLVLCQRQLLVIKRAKPMCIIKKYENVTKVQVRDRLCLGRPQAVIWTTTDKEPVVTDFVNGLYSVPLLPVPVPPLTLSLRGKLQEMNVRLEKARKLLQETRTTRSKSLYDYVPHLTPTPKQTPLQSEPKVLAWGSPCPMQGPASLPPLRLSTLWRRVHNNHWVIGVPVYNSSDTVVEAVRLRLQQCGAAAGRLSYRTAVAVLPGGPTFTMRPDIPAHTAAVILGILEEPLFKESSVITLYGALVYSTAGTGRNYQDLLDSVQFSVQDLVHGCLSPFSSPDTPVDDGERDLLSVVVSSAHWRLRVSCRLDLSLHRQLSALGMQPQPSLALAWWLGSPSTGLAGVLVMVQGLHTLELYARDTKQALLLIQGLLMTGWRVEVDEEARDGTKEQDCAQHLAAELRWLQTQLRPGASYSAQDWSQLRSQLTELELATDTAFLAQERKHTTTSS